MRLRPAWRRLRARTQAVLHPRAAEAAMQRELAAHLALMEEDLQRRGLSAEAARREARLRFGSSEAAAEAHRAARGFAAVEQLAHDTRLALRSLRHAPAFTITAVLTLTLGLGAAMAVFTVVNSVLLEPLPYPEAHRLVALRQLAPGAGGVANAAGGLGLSESMFLTFKRYNHSFSAMGIWTADMASITGRGQPQRVPAVDVSDGVLQALAVPPLRGRWLGPGDHELHGAATVMLSYGYWQREFGGAAAAIGSTLEVDGRVRVIVGVMPPGFRIEDQPADLIVPLAFAHTGLKLAGFGYQGLARLKPGATLTSADAELTRLLPVWMNSWTNCPKCDPHFYETWHITPALRPLKSAVVGGIAGTLWIVLATVGLLLLIAMGNAINLFLVRAEARQHELAVRAALGAGRARLAQALLLESTLVAGAGFGLGLAAAEAAIVWLRALGPVNLPRLTEVGLDLRVAGGGVALAIVAALGAGLAPLWRRHFTTITPTLAGESRGASASRQRRRVRSALIVAQTAMALVLLLAAGLLVRSFAALTRVQPGFSQPQTVQTFRVAIPHVPGDSDAMVVRTENDIVNRLQAIPGVTAAGFADQAPMQKFGGDWDIVVKRGEAVAAGSSPPSRWFTFVSPGYLCTLGTAVIAGRDFTWADLYAERHYVLLSRNLAREFFGSAQAAVGQQVSPSGPGNWYEVIGVVQDVHIAGAQQPAPTMVYWPALTPGLWGSTSMSQRVVTVAVRTPQAGTAALHAQILRAVAAVSPEIPLTEYATMQQIYAQALAVASFTLALLAMAGVMALALGLIGIYGVIAYEVVQRQREIGIRIALGASRGSVRALFLRRGLGLAALGCGLGLLAGAGLTHSLHALLFQISPLDPLTFLLAPVLLLLAVICASYLPARRASAQPAAAVLRS